MLASCNSGSWVPDSLGWITALHTPVNLHQCLEFPTLYHRTRRTGATTREEKALFEFTKSNMHRLSPCLKCVGCLRRRPPSVCGWNVKRTLSMYYDEGHPHSAVSSWVFRIGEFLSISLSENYPYNHQIDLSVLKYRTLPSLSEPLPYPTPPSPPFFHSYFLHHTPTTQWHCLIPHSVMFLV